MHKPFGIKLMEARLRAGLSQTYIARETGIPQRRLSHFEKLTRFPSHQEITRLVEFGLVSRPTSDEGRAIRSYPTRWRLKPLTVRRTSERSLKSRIYAARKTYGSEVSVRLRALGSREDRKPKVEFLAQAGLESGIEAFALLSLLAEGARVLWAAPCRAGFRRLPIIDPKSKDVISDAKFPALELTVAGVPAILFPQLTVMVQGAVYRLDGLLGLKLDKKRAWLNLEIDGGGHISRFDEEREDRLDMLTIRLTESDLRGSVTERIGQKARLLPLAIPAG